jgi:hypothetical protein
MKRPDFDKLLGGLLSWLLPIVAVAAAVLAFICVRAEERGHLYEAQGAFGVILFLLFLSAWAIWEWHEDQQGKARRLVSRDFEAYSQALRFLLRFVGVGFVAVILNAMRYEFWVHGLVAKVTSVGILLAGAAFIIGTLFGFLFGFPPSPTPSQASGDQGAKQGASGNNGTTGQQSQSAFYNNTNLQEISDWLTKVIVGASLVELTKLPPQVEQLANFIAKGVNPFDPAPAVVLALLGYFSSCGVLYGYIWTKYEAAATSQGPDSDALALSAVDDWLHRPPDPKDDPGPMMAAIRVASPATRVRIFLQTEKYRAASTEDVNERALPMLEALVEADAEEIFHRVRGQYALALMGRKKDRSDAASSEGDWSKAQDQLTDAIRIRDMSREPNWREYELARAVCKIHLELEFNEKQEPNSIDRDLEQAKDAVPPERRKLIDKDDAVTTKDGKKVSAATAWADLTKPKPDGAP